MPAFLLMFGVAAAIVFGTRAHRKHAPNGAFTQYELDHGMPDAVVDRVLGALVHENDSAVLDALARELESKYPLSAAELRAKATTLRAPRPAPFVPPAPAGVAPRGGHMAVPPAPALHPSAPSDAAVATVLQAAMKALVQEPDPVELEGFAESIREPYPSASALLVSRARDLRLAGAVAKADSLAGSPTAEPAPPPPPVASLPAPVEPAPTAPTYTVRAGDNAEEIARKLAHDARRWPELVAANPSKPTTKDGNFAALRPGEVLHVPASWTTHSAPTEAHEAAKEMHP